MAALSDNVGLLFRVKAETSDAVRDLNAVQGGIREVGAAGTGAAGGIASMVNPVTLVTAGITAMAAAAVTGITALYGLTKSASDFGGEIYDAQVKTGLTAATLGTLKLNADNAGSSFEQITGTVVKFSQLLGQANQGNEKAIATLTKYGITATTTDGALQQAIASIAKMEDADQRAAAAKELFKDKTAALLPVIDQMAGDLKAATKEAERLGTQVSEKNIRAADAFGDQMGVLNAQLGAAGRTIGFALMPELTKMANYLSEFLARNQAQIANVGDRIATIFARIIGGFNSVKNWIESNQGIIRVALALGTLGASEVALAGTQALVGLADKLSSGRTVAPTPQEYAGQATPGFTAADDPSVAKAEADKRAAERQRARERDLAAQKDSLRIEIEAQGDATERIFKQWEDAYLNKEVDETKFREVSEQNWRIYATNVKKLLVDAFKLDSQGKTPLEIENLSKLQQKAAQATLDDIAKMREDREKTITGIVKKEQKQQEEDNKEHFTRLKEALNQDADEYIAKVKAWVDQVTKDMALLASLPSVPLPVPELSTEGSGEGSPLNSFDKFIGSFAEGIAKYLEGIALVRNANGELEFSMKQVFTSLADLGIQAFGQLAAGFGQMVSNWVLYGNAGEQGLKKLTATILAQVSATATTYALMCLAAAALATTVWGAALLGGTPAQFLQAAAIFGAAAVGTAIAGRALAGDSFNQSTTAGATSGSSNGQSQGGDSYTSGQFGGFGQRLNNTLAAVEETTNRLANKIESFRPGDVLGMGVEQNPNAVSDGLISGLQNNSRLTGMLKRATGDAR